MFLCLFKTHLMFQIHRLLSKHFGSFLESKTFNKQHSKAASDGGSYIQIRMRARGPKPLQQKDNKDEPKYVHWSVFFSVCVLLWLICVCLFVCLSVCLSAVFQSVSQSVSDRQTDIPSVIHSDRKTLTHLPNQHVKLLHTIASSTMLMALSAQAYFGWNGSFFQTGRNWIHRICIR